ncbi:hypothetical protein ABZ370_31255 [Streptomyces sp. NPDC005962]|uniref:hypothetical protein n=1 Tax=Streptomyces sp. NPDC005962 TaxID=3154466 RepID=UPI0033EDC1FB
MGSPRPRHSARRNLMVRAAHHTGVQVSSWPDLADATPAGVRSWCTWMRGIWGIAEVAEAVRHASPALGRDLLPQASTLAVPAAAWPALRRLPGGQALLESHWTQRHAALVEYRARLDHTRHSDPDAVDALLHHLSLADTTPPGSGSTPWRLARAVALTAAQGDRPKRNGLAPTPPAAPQTAPTTNGFTAYAQK